MDVRGDPDGPVVEMTLPGGPDITWSVLTDPQHILQWWGDYVAFTPGPDGGLVEEWQDSDGRPQITRGRIIAWDPPHTLKMTWEDEGRPGITTVSIILSQDPAGPRTRLSLVHSGWASLDLSEDDRQRLIAEHAAGWSVHLRDLRAEVSDLLRNRH